MTLCPCRASSRTNSNRRSVSLGERAEVGSSMMSTWAPEVMTRAISTNWCTPRGYSSSRLRTSRENPRLLSAASASANIRFQSTIPADVVGWRPRKMFSATVSTGMTLSSWWIMAMP